MSEEMSENCLNPRDSLSDSSESHKKHIILQPIRIKDMLDMYDNEDDDSDNKNYDSEEENESEEGPSLTPITEKTMGDSKNNSKKCANTPGEESLDPAKNNFQPVAASRQNFNWKNYIEEKNKRRASASKDLFHSENNLQQIKTDRRSQPVNQVPFDFARMKIDESKNEIISYSEVSQVQAELHVVSSAKSQSARSTSSENEMAIASSDIMRHNTFSSEGKESLHSIIDKHVHGASSYKLDSGIQIPSGSSQKSNSAMLSDSAISNPPSTPLKLHNVAGSMRPMPSISRRNMFQTPQGKAMDFPTPHEQTPASIFSTWRHGNTMHTSLHSRVEPDIEETPGKTVISKIDKPPWKLDNSAKRVRRPLVETMMPPEPSRLYNENLGHFSQKDNITGVDNFVKQKVLDTPIIPISKTTSALVESSNDVNYDLKENLGPMSFQLPPKVPDQLQPPRELDKKQTNCLPPTSSSVAVPATPEPLQSLPTISTANSNNNKNLVKQPDNKLFQPMSISAAPPCQYGKKMSVKGKEYIILGTLGQGMSGEVYRVQDTSNLELKAIKYVNLARMDHESAQSCLNEIKMLNKLQAPSVVTMYDHEVSNRSIYVVMEMGDTDLSRFLKSVSAEKRTLPLTMILYYWTEMLTAVKHIHDNGVIHSDLKPANFLLVRGRLKLIDFGISSSLNAEMTSIVKSTTVGTLNYISPEALMDVGGTGDSPHQNTKYKISYKSDVWSLGCILYSLVYGITPFHNIRQQWAKINAITNPHPRISYSLPPHVEAVPVILIDVIKKCLQHDPKARPSVDQLLQVQYISMARNVPISSPDIPANILIKIKQSLQDSEWRIFTEVLGQRRPH